MANERTRAPAADELAGESKPVDVPVARASPALTKSSERTYSDSQVAAILQRTAQLERGRQQEKPALSLAEVEQIAREAGLDPSLVRVAARSLEEKQREGTLGARFLGEPTSRTFERVIEGELSLAEHEALGADLMAAFRREGSPFHPPRLSTLGRSLTLNVQGVELTLSPRDGKTLLRINVDCGQLAGGFFGGLGCGVGVGLMPVIFVLAQINHLGAAATVASCAGLLAGSVGLARTLYGWRARAFYARMEKAADGLESRVREEIARRAN